MENGNPAVNPEEYKNRGNSSKAVTIAMFAFMAVFFLFLIFFFQQPFILRRAAAVF